MSVEFQAKNRDLVELALKELGYGFHEIRPGVLGVRLGGFLNVLDLDKGRAKWRFDQVEELNKLKRHYSRKAIELVARRNRWRFAASTSHAGTLLRTG